VALADFIILSDKLIFFCLAGSRFSVQLRIGRVVTKKPPLLLLIADQLLSRNSRKIILLPELGTSDTFIDLLIFNTYQIQKKV
jgi:hypothetical protein